MLLPFDAHNHVHMGPTPPVQALLPTDLSETPQKAAVSGMAIMSTHPRDFDHVMHLSRTLPNEVEGSVQVVPCFGVHPWFLHELSDLDREFVEDGQPRWINEMECLIKANPNAIVGEIGLDGFHYDPETEELTSTMSDQVEAFRMQMELAARLERPVSIHTVQCFGPLFDTLSQIKKDAKNAKRKPALPPKIYFHAFGGKPATIDQISALCGRSPNKVYFGFAPIINFRSKKTADVIRKVGIERLVLETDHEDAARVPSSMQQCIEFLASTLDMEKEDVIEQTTKNAFELYNLN